MGQHAIPSVINSRCHIFTRSPCIPRRCRCCSIQSPSPPLRFLLASSPSPNPTSNKNLSPSLHPLHPLFHVPTLPNLTALASRPPPAILTPPPHSTHPNTPHTHTMPGIAHANLARLRVSLVSPQMYRPTFPPEILTKSFPNAQIVRPDPSRRSGMMVAFQLLQRLTLQPNRRRLLVPRGPYSAFGTLQYDAVGRQYKPNASPAYQPSGTQTLKDPLPTSNARNRMRTKRDLDTRLRTSYHGHTAHFWSRAKPNGQCHHTFYARQQLGGDFLTRSPLHCRWRSLSILLVSRFIKFIPLNPQLHPATVWPEFFLKTDRSFQIPGVWEGQNENEIYEVPMYGWPRRALYTPQNLTDGGILK